MPALSTFLPAKKKVARTGALVAPITNQDARIDLNTFNPNINTAPVVPGVTPPGATPPPVSTAAVPGATNPNAVAPPVTNPTPTVTDPLTVKPGLDGATTPSTPLNGFPNYAPPPAGYKVATGNADFNATYSAIRDKFGDDAAMSWATKNWDSGGRELFQSMYGDNSSAYNQAINSHTAGGDQSSMMGGQIITLPDGTRYYVANNAEGLLHGKVALKGGLNKAQQNQAIMRDPAWLAKNAAKLASGEAPDYRRLGEAPTAPPPGAGPPPGTPPPHGDNLPGYGDTDYSEPLTDISKYLDPSFDFRLQEGTDNLSSRYAGAGNFLSGEALKGITKYGQELASTEYGNAFSRALLDTNRRYGVDTGDRDFAYRALTGDRDYNATRLRDLIGFGQNANQGSNAVAIALAQLLSGNTMSAGGAQGAGTIGGSNAINTAISQILATMLQGRALNTPAGG